jgi:hypothetical protein
MCDDLKRVGQHELVLRIPHRHYRTRRRADDSFGDAAEEEVRHAPAAVCARDDQIGVGLFPSCSIHGSLLNRAIALTAAS